ncbi:hypothetical protein BaRGS_00032565 [Batillaria attramentaria]|uniref:Uncharacterized protein n=1 Tax=Batillaria attramentaria TaxID=370345 RepID=A0ABD0JMN7_9CAEN
MHRLTWAVITGCIRKREVTQKGIMGILLTCEQECVCVSVDLMQFLCKNLNSLRLQLVGPTSSDTPPLSRQGNKETADMVQRRLSGGNFTDEANGACKSESLQTNLDMQALQQDPDSLNMNTHSLSAWADSERFSCRMSLFYKS